MNKRLLMIIAVFTAFTYAQSGITELKLKQMNGKKTKLSTYLKAVSYTHLRAHET